MVAVPDNASLVTKWADAIKSTKTDALPEWKIAEFNGDHLKQHEWYCQIKSAIETQSFIHDVKLTFPKTLVAGKEKIAVAEFVY